MDTQPITYVTNSSIVYIADFETSLAAAAGCDLIFTSPPYENARTYGNDVSWSFEDYQRLGDAAHASLKPGGHMLMVLNGPVYQWRKGKGTERSFMPFKVMLDWAERIGFRVPDRLVYGRRGTIGRFLGRFRNDWEPLFWFQKVGGESKPFFDKTCLNEEASTKSTGAASTRLKNGNFKRRVLSGSIIAAGVRERGTLWNYSSVGGRGNDEPEAIATNHPARFCMRLAEDVVRCFCPPGGLVCDPFVGSGNTAVASVRYGRDFVGGDLFGDSNNKSWALWTHERVIGELEKLSKETPVTIETTDMRSDNAGQSSSIPGFTTPPEG